MKHAVLRRGCAGGQAGAAQAYRQQHRAQHPNAGAAQPGQRAGRCQAEQLPGKGLAGPGPAWAQGNEAAEQQQRDKGSGAFRQGRERGGQPSAVPAEKQHQPRGQQEAHRLLGALVQRGVKGVLPPIAIARIHAAQPQHRHGGRGCQHGGKRPCIAHQPGEGRGEKHKPRREKERPAPRQRQPCAQHLGLIGRCAACGQPAHGGGQSGGQRGEGQHAGCAGQFHHAHGLRAHPPGHEQPQHKAHGPGQAVSRREYHCLPPERCRHVHRLPCGGSICALCLHNGREMKKN